MISQPFQTDFNLAQCISGKLQHLKILGEGLVVLGGDNVVPPWDRVNWTAKTAYQKLFQNYESIIHDEK